MDGTLPVFTDYDDIRTWKELCRLEKEARNSFEGRNVFRNILKKLINRENELRDLIKRICSKAGPVNPRILSKTIFVADLYLLNDLKNIVLELLEKCSITDSTFQIEAAEMLVSKGAYDSARLILDRMTIISNIARWEHIRGLIDIHEGNAEAAKARFIKAYGFDDTYMGVYRELERIEPGPEWPLRRKIALANIRSGTDSLDHVPGTPLEEVYDLYCKANTGDIEAAIKELTESSGVQSGNRDSILAAARICRMNGEYQRSIEYYTLLIGDTRESFSVGLELARTYVLAGMYRDAIQICADLSKVCSADRRLMEIEIDAYSGDRNTFQLGRTIDMYLFNDYADLSAYIYAATAFIDASMNIEASNLITKMLVMHSDEAVIHYKASVNDFLATKYITAQDSAMRAMRKDPSNSVYQLHYAKVCLASAGRFNKRGRAKFYINKVLSKDAKNYDALVLKMEMEEGDGNLNEALDICNRILSFRPRDADTLRSAAVILDKLERYDESLKMYREALCVRDDPMLFTTVIDGLARNGRYADAVNMVCDYDDIYGYMPDIWVIKGNCQYALGDYLNATESYEKATAIDKNNPEVWHSKGLSEEMAEDYENAEISYNKAVLIDLDNQDYWISKSSIQEKKGDYVGAVNSLNRVIEMHPENIYSLMKKAVILVRLGKVDEALIFIDMALRIDSNSLEIMRMKRDICIHKNDFEGSVKICKQIIGKDPEDADTMILLAQVYMNNRMYREASELLDRADGIRPDDMEVMCLMRSAAHEIGNHLQESIVCKKILQVDPGNKEIMLALADAYVEMKMNADASDIYDRLRALMPQDSDIALKKAKTEDAETAIEILKESLEKDPENESVLLEISHLSAQQGDIDEALAYSDLALKANPRSSDAYVMKANMLLESGDPNGAMAVINDAIPVVDTVPPILWKYMGDAQNSVSDHQNAMISYDTAIKLGMDGSDVYRARGNVQEKMGLSDAAINSYSVACTKDPKDVRSWERIASIQMAEGNENDATRTLDDAINTAPAYGPILLMRAKLYRKSGDVNGIKRIAGISRISLSEDNGFRYDIEMIFNEMVGSKEQDDSEAIELYAVQLLNMAKETNLQLDDPKLAENLGLTPETTDAVLAYLSDIKECVNPGPSMHDFDKMESMSYKAVTEGDISDLEHDSLIPLTVAYFNTGAKSLNEAKRVIGYVYAVMNSDIKKEVLDESIPEMVAELKDTPDMSVTEIMKLYRIGVYTARTIKLLSEDDQ